MSLPSLSSPPETAIFAQPYAVRLGLTLLIAFALIIAFAGYDQSRREKLESFEEVTAVGDRNLFEIPADRLIPGPAAVIFKGEPLYPVSYETIEIDDSSMLRAGVADRSSQRIYLPREPLEDDNGEPRKQDAKARYLKVEPNEYIEVRPR